MKKTYIGTIFNPNISEAEIKVVRYNKCKYLKDSEPVERSYITKVTSWDWDFGDVSYNDDYAKIFI